MRRWADLAASVETVVFWSASLPYVANATGACPWLRWRHHAREARRAGSRWRNHPRTSAIPRVIAILFLCLHGPHGAGAAAAPALEEDSRPARNRDPANGSRRAKGTSGVATGGTVWGVKETPRITWPYVAGITVEKLSLPGRVVLARLSVIDTSWLGSAPCPQLRSPLRSWPRFSLFRRC